MKCNLDNLKEALAAMAKDGKVDGIPLEVAMMRLSSRYTAMQIGAIAGSSKFVDNMKTIGTVSTKVAEKAQIGSIGGNSKDIVKNLEKAYNKDRKTAVKHLPKELAKASVATKMIGQGATISSAETTRQVYNSAGLANNEEYTSNDVVFLSANGNRAGRVVPVVNGELQGVYKLVDKAIAAGASFVADSAAHLSETGSYNLGEVALAKYLIANGYVRTNLTIGKETIGKWTKISKTIGSLALSNDGKDYIVGFADSSEFKEVKSYEELLEITRNYETVMRSLPAVRGSSNGEKRAPIRSVDDLKHVGEMFTLLEKNGIGFRDMKVMIEKGPESNTFTGYYKEDGGKRELYSYYDRDNITASPAEVVLHEYFHALTLVGINNNTVLARKIKSLMDRVLEANPDLNKVGAKTRYAFTSPVEFIAEVGANPTLRQALDAIVFEGEKQTALQQVLDWIQEVLDSFGGKDIAKVTALTKALELTMKAMQQKTEPTKITLDSVEKSRIEGLSEDVVATSMLNQLLADGKLFSELESLVAEGEEAKSIFEEAVEDSIEQDEARDDIDNANAVILEHITAYHESLVKALRKTQEDYAYDVADAYSTKLLKLKYELEPTTLEKVPTPISVKKLREVFSKYAAGYEEIQTSIMPKGTKQYHISDASFDRFAVAGDEIPGYGKLKTVGSHIGEVESAKEYEKQQTWSKGKVKYEVTANADVNTLEMTDPGDSNWTADTMYDELVEKYGEVPFNKESDAKEVLDFLRSKDIDAIKYKNTAEAGVSYMILNPEKFDLNKIEEWPGEQMQEASKAEAKPEIGKMSLAELLKEAAECKE